MTPAPEIRPDPEIPPSRSIAARTGAMSANSLVALGTAAVIAVYAAGYQRTRPAADLWAAENGARRVAATPVRISPDTLSQLLAASQSASAPSRDSATPAAPPAGITGNHTDANSDANAAAKSAEMASVKADAKVNVKANVKVNVKANVKANAEDSLTHAATLRRPVERATATVASAATSGTVKQVSVVTKPKAPVSAPNAASTSPESAAVPSPTATPASPASQTSPTPSAPAPVTGAATAAAATAPGTPTTPAAPSYRDGMFIGYGTSRHGDIEAMVEIKDGRIISAVISRCLTRYSCSWIAALPPQVVARQSADVDYVSGATQSANAFYYAVTQALQQAK